MQYIIATDETGNHQRVTVDDESFAELSQYRWRVVKGYVVAGKLRIHRLVVGVHEIPASVLEVDHINNDKLDNRRANLRLATKAQNQRNQPLRKDNKSGVKGVSWDAKCELWEVRVKVNGKQKFGGRFALLAEATQAAKNLRELLHGRFANHGTKAA
jgi:hypothetical protein